MDMDDGNEESIDGGRDAPSNAGGFDASMLDGGFEGFSPDSGNESFGRDGDDGGLLTSADADGTSDSLYFESEAGGFESYTGSSDYGLSSGESYISEYDEAVWADDSDLYDAALFDDNEEVAYALEPSQPGWWGEEPKAEPYGHEEGKVEERHYGDPILSDDWKDIDFTTTMNTPYEQSVLRDMHALGQIDIPEIQQHTEEPEFAANRLPSKDSGTFEGERGNSAFVPNSEEARAELAKFGERAIVYQNDYPQFGPVTTHDSPYGRLECEVQIGHMTPDRNNPTWQYGDRRPTGTSHNQNFDLGNFAQADNALVDQAIEKNPGLVQGKTPDEIANLRTEMAKNIEGWRKSSGLTWHECQDGVTMQLVPTVIHNACRHTGGVSVTGTLQAYGAR